MIQDLKELGLRTGSLRRALASDIGVAASRKVLFLNWYEDRVSSSSFSWVQLFLSIVVLMILRLRVGTIVWIRHNEVAHANGGSLVAKKFLRYVLEKVVNIRVTLRPSVLGDVVLPHPVYSLSRNFGELVGGLRGDSYILFGSIRANKGYDELLSWWPVGRKLLIVGKCSDADLAVRLRSIIEKRELNVEWQDRFVPDEELDQMLAASRYAIITHRDGTSLVSGTFYHAASLGVNTFVTPGEFQRHLTERFSFARPLTIETLNESAYTEARNVTASLQASNGTQARLGALRALFSKMNLCLPN